LRQEQRQISGASRKEEAGKKKGPEGDYAAALQDESDVRERTPSDTHMWVGGIRVKFGQKNENLFPQSGRRTISSAHTPSNARPGSEEKKRGKLLRCKTRLRKK